MRLPRFTMRRLMVIVAGTALALGVGIDVVRICDLAYSARVDTFRSRSRFQSPHRQRSKAPGCRGLRCVHWA
jgi:hypothetical protein